MVFQMYYDLNIFNLFTELLINQNVEKFHFGKHYQFEQQQMAIFLD